MAKRYQDGIDDVSLRDHLSQNIVEFAARYVHPGKSPKALLLKIKLLKEIAPWLLPKGAILADTSESMYIVKTSVYPPPKYCHSIISFLPLQFFV
jgi:hypothetical protein